MVAWISCSGAKLDAFHEKYPHQLSGGMRQRAALGQDPRPVAPAGTVARRAIRCAGCADARSLNLELLRLWKDDRKTVLLITHSISEAVFLSDRVLVMSDRPGRVIADIRIPFPRPRQFRLTTTAEFGAFVDEIRALLGASVDA